MREFHVIRGDGIRRNIATVDADERLALIAAIKTLNSRHYPGSRGETPVGGVSLWFKQDEIHQATHVHQGPEFVPWHRELCNRFEQLIRTVDPRLSLHYWDWTTDPSPLFTPDVMGSKNGAAGEPWLSAGFYVPNADPYRGDSAFDSEHSNPFDPPRTLTRQVQGGVPGLQFGDADILDEPDFFQMRLKLEASHDDAHTYVGGTIGDPHTSFRDPFVFLIHSNVDRLYAMWQAADPANRLDPTRVYGFDASDPTWYTRTLAPWDGGTTRPWAPPENEQVARDYQHPSVVAPPCYDTLPPVYLVEVVNPGATVNFNDVPEGETAIRAAVFRVYACGDVTFKVTAAPAAPYGVFIPPGEVTVHHGPTPYTEARIWFAFTGGDPAAAVPDGAVTVHCEQNNTDYPFVLKANSITRPTVAVALALDQSGSMDDPAGSTGAKRIEVLKEAATRFVEVLQPGNGVGIVRFDHDSYAVNDPNFPGLAIMQMGSGGALDPNRGLAVNAVGQHATNPAGATSIGDGVERARQLANTAPATFSSKALIVFTDGLENTPRTIAEVAPSIDARTFAIGLGTESQVSTAALTALANGTGGYLLLSGHLTPSTDDYFRLSKFFLQILAGVTNTDIVVDPTGTVAPGIEVRIPFDLAETDIDVTVVLMDDLPVLDLALETPSGDLIDPGAAAGLGALFAEGTNLSYYRLNLPVPVGAGQHAGRWHAVLTVDERLFKKYLTRLADSDRQAYVRLATHGPRYSLNVLTFSNLRMAARIVQPSLEPGAHLTVRAVLTEYGQPVERRAAVTTAVLRPDGTSAQIPLAEIEPGVFEGSFLAALPGTYQCRVVASGSTFRGAAFTREQALTGAVLRGGDGPPPYGGSSADPGREAWCRVLRCLLADKQLAAFLARHEIDAEQLARCLRALCEDRRPHTEVNPRAVQQLLENPAVMAAVRSLTEDDRT